MELENRLNRLEEKLKTADFRKNKGKANEVNYHIFDYDAKEELRIRERIEYLKSKYKDDNFDFNLKVFDLYDIIMDIILKEEIFEICTRLEKKRGIHEVRKAINELIRSNEDTTENEIIKHISDNINSQSVVMLVGIGKVFPFLRSHKILNNLHQCIDDVPVIMFYPGKYEDGYLSLFSEIKDDNYYRAFRFE